MGRNLTFLLVAVLCTASFAQEKPLPSFLAPKKDTTKSSSKTDQLSAQHSLLLFEDIFNRLYDHATLSESYQYDFHKSRYTQTNGQKFSSDFDHHYLFLSGGYGKRDKYEMSSTINMMGGELAGRNSYRDFNVNFNWRPRNSWQISSGFGTSEQDNSGVKDNFDWDGSLIYLSQGQINMAPEKFSHYFFFRDILLERNQWLILCAPQYSYHKSNGDDSSDLSKLASLPITFGYGLSNVINLRLNFQIKVDEDNYDYLIFSTEPSNSEKIGTSSYKHQFENSSSDIGLYLIPNQRFLFEGFAKFDHRGETYRHNEQYVNGFRQFSKIVNKHDAYAIHFKANYLSVQRVLSAVDFRRSFYNGIYLKKAELKNQFQYNFYSQEYDEASKWSLRDEFDLGLTDNINFSVNAEYDRMKDDYASQNDKNWWEYSTGLTFYNLNFSWDELNDFDYFYGRIVQPRDYIGTIRWYQSHETYHHSSDWKSIGLDLKTGLLSNMDVQLNYSYDRTSDESSSGSGHNFGAGLRMNVLNNFRVNLNASHYKYHAERSNNLYSYPISDSYHWHVKIDVQTLF